MQITNTNKKTSVKINFILNFSIQLMTYLIPVILSPYLSRVLLPEGIGANSSAFSIASYFSIFTSFGFVAYGTKVIAQKREDSEHVSNVFWNIFVTKIFLFIFAIILYFVIINISSITKLASIECFLIYGLLILSSLLDITYLFQGLENFKIISILNIFSRLIGMILIFFLVKTIDDLPIYILVYCSQIIFVNFISWLFAFKYIKLKKIKFISIFKCLKESLFFFLPALIVSLASMIDKTMLGLIKDTTQVGYYEEASKITSLIVNLICSLTPVMLSRMSNLYDHGEKKEIEAKIVQMFEVLYILALPSFAGLYLIADIFIPTFFGSQFQNSVEIMYMLAPVVFLTPAINYIGNALFLPKNKVKEVSVIYGIGEILNIVLNIPLIIYFGPIGAAFSSVFADLIILSAFILRSKENINYKKILKLAIKPLVSTFFMILFTLLIKKLLVVVFIDNMIIQNITVVLVAILIYGFISLMIKENLIYYMFRKIFKKFKGAR